MIASDVVAALRVKFPANAYAFFEQVADGTGHAANRHLDVVVVGLWPSRGLDRHGFEVKVSRQDLQRELASPEKADAVARHLDFFSLATPAGLANPADLPSAWGLIEVGHKGCSWKKQPEKLEPRENSRPFFAALCRAAVKENDALRSNSIPVAEYQRRIAECLQGEVEKRLEALVRTRVDAEVSKYRNAAGSHHNLEEGLAEFARISGVPVPSLKSAGVWQWKNFARAFSAAIRLYRDIGQLRNVSDHLESIVKTLRDVSASIPADDNDEG